VAGLHFLQALSRLKVAVKLKSLQLAASTALHKYPHQCGWQRNMKLSYHNFIFRFINRVTTANTH
jgi:hypothetical protein